jgi:hypothetical protein
MKKTITIRLVLVFTIVNLIACQAQAPDQEQSTGNTPTGNSSATLEVPVEKVFNNKIVYTTSREVNKSKLSNHCKQKGGEFNTCGRVCGPDTDMCAEVCAYTCEDLDDSK